MVTGVSKISNIDIYKCAGLSHGLGGCETIIYVCLFAGHFLWRRKHINKISPKTPGQSREFFVCVCFIFMCCFSLPINLLLGKPTVTPQIPLCSHHVRGFRDFG